VESTSIRILRSSTYFSIFRHRYEPRKITTTGKLGKLKLFLIPRNRVCLLFTLTRTPYHTCFPIKEERNDLYDSCAHAGIRTIKRQGTQCMYTVTLRRVLATIVVVYILSFFVALIIQLAQGMHRVILSPVACPAVQYFTTLSHKRHDYRGKLLNVKCVL
jgi:hypothetical protein